MKKTFTEEELILSIRSSNLDYPELGKEKWIKSISELNAVNGFNISNFFLFIYIPLNVKLWIILNSNESTATKEELYKILLFSIKYLKKTNDNKSFDWFINSIKITYSGEGNEKILRYGKTAIYSVRKNINNEEVYSVIMTINYCLYLLFGPVVGKGFNNIVISLGLEYKEYVPFNHFYQSLSDFIENSL